MGFWILCAAAVVAVLIGTIAGEVSKATVSRAWDLAEKGDHDL